MTQTDQQNVPKLRFPGFEGAWEETRMGKHTVKVGSGVTPKGGASVYQDSGIPLLRSQNVRDSFLDLSDVAYISDEIHESMSGSHVQDGDVLLNITGASIGRSCVAPPGTSPANVNQHVCIIRLDHSNSSEFIQTILASPKGEKLIFQSQAGGGREGLNFENVRKFKIHLPTLPEQRKIAGFLGAVDTKIAQLAEKKRLLEDYKKGCMQQLFSQKIRFKYDDGNDFPDWEEKPLHSFLTETKAKSDGTEAVFSVSVHKGLIDQVEHLGRSYSATDTSHYNRVEPGDIVYTKSPTGEFPYGIIKQSRLNRPVIVSPLYGVFRPETPWLGYWLNVYFESNIHTGNYLKPIIQKGAKNTINITNTTFLSAKLKVPVHPDEQRKIADFLSALDRKIDLVGAELEHAKTFKQGLLQQMFV